MKRILRATTLAILLLSLIAGIALAAWEYRFPAICTDTGAAARTYYPAILTSAGGSFDGQDFINNGKIAATGVDTNMQIGSSDVKYMLSTTRILSVIPSLPASGKVTIALYTGYTPNQTNFPVITGDGGYVTITDDAALEGGNDFDFETEGYIHTTAAYVDDEIIGKGGAVSMYIVSAGNLQGVMAGAATNIQQGVQDFSYAQYTGNNEGVGQRIDDFDGYIYEVRFYLEKIGAPAGTGYARIYNADTNTLLGTVGSVDVATLGVPAWVTFNTTVVPVMTTQDIRVVFVYQGGAVGNRVDHYLKVADVCTGVSTTSNDVVTWTDAGGADDMFHLYWYDYLQVDVAVASGEHTAKIYADTVNFGIIVDEGEAGEVSDTVALGGASMLDNTSDWVLSGDPAPYIDVYSHTAGAGEDVHYEPAAMLTDTTVINSLNPGTYDGTITWGTNTNLTVTYGEMSSSESTSGAASTLEGFDMPTSPLPSTWFASGEGVSGLPFYESFLDVSVQTGQPVQTIYFIAFLGFAFGVFMLIVVTTKSVLISAISFNISLFIGSSMTIVPMWIPFVCMVVMLGILYLYRQVSY